MSLSVRSSSPWASTCITEPLALAIEGKAYGPKNHEQGEYIIPSQRFPKIEPGEGNEDQESDRFLQDFQLVAGHRNRSHAICGHHQAIFKKSDPPARQDDNPYRLIPKFQVAVPGEGHEDVTCEQQERSRPRGIHPLIMPRGEVGS